MNAAGGNLAARTCFLMERQVGIGSAAGAIEPYLKSQPNVSWADITYVKDGGLIERAPFPGRVGGTLRGVVQTNTALNGGPFDVLFFLTHNPAVFQQRAVARTPTLLWTDVTPALLDAQAAQYGHALDKFRVASALKRALVKRTFHLASLCLGWSEWARRSFVEHYGVQAERTAVLPPGIDLSRWELPVRASRNELPRLLFVGGDFARKGGDLLLDVFREHLRGRCELDIVTRDPVAEEAGVRVHHHLTAGSEPLVALYRNASIFVLPTRGDCFSIASLEAMAMGLPVVVSDVGGISDIVEPERSGYLIEAGSGRSLRTALDAALQSDEQRVAQGLRGRRIVEESFDARQTAQRILAYAAQVSGK